MTEGGRINRVSVAVLVDGSYSKNDKGETVYQPRDKEEIDRIAALVRSAIGFDQKRGDQVEIVNLRFADVPTNTIPEPQGMLSFLQFTKDDVMHWIEQLVMVLLGLVVLLLVVRPLVRRILAPEEAAPQAAIAAAIAEGNVQGAIAAGASVEEIKAVPSADRQDDRHRPGAGPGARPVGAEGRRARRQEPQRDRLHHPDLAARERGLKRHRSCLPPTMNERKTGTRARSGRLPA